MTTRPGQREETHFAFIKRPVYLWEWCLNGDWFALTVHVQTNPPAFYRFMQRWLLGIHWRKCK